MTRDEIIALGKEAKRSPDAPFRPGSRIDKYGRVIGTEQCDSCAASNVRVWDVGYKNLFCSHCVSRHAETQKNLARNWRF